ncbi:uncharacterized protein LOC122655978 isoform X2 [Telopea speciosissima]|uniref:uncharacterized protein LOC122655978 isoform X2 n=1 Tax=Telopea speciosissima TaxID=54955 RepID=UPI001CC42263|nr:uncharacterized protein LOC122655978 isoform X2 [Telopea speciosissima]
MHSKDEEKLLKHRFSSCFDDDLRRAYADSEWTGTMAYRSWKHVLRSTGGNESHTSRLYKEAVGRVEKKARAVYVEEDTTSKDEFVQIMIEQGCFILQVVLCSLGGPKLLGYPPNDPFFGENRWNKEQIRRWVTSIFSVKKQIPLVVLKVLMKQSFFQKVLKSGKWKRPKDLARMALYDFVVEPMLDEPVNHRSSIRRLLGFLFNKRRSRRFHQEPVTPLHALWLLLTGPVGSRRGGGANHIEEDEADHLYTTLSSVRSIMELQSSGIAFKSDEGLGTRQITFTKRMLDAHLYLPCIYMEHDTMALFQNLIDYEAAVGMDINGREISAYISFMKELIRSRDDVKVLVQQGIIDTNPDFENELPGKLWSLDTLEVGNSHNLVSIRRQIRRYVRPSIRAKMVNLVVIGVFLTLVQTIYTALSYHHPHV